MQELLRISMLQSIGNKGQLGMPASECVANVRTLEKRGLVYKVGRLRGRVTYLITEKGKVALQEFYGDQHDH